MTNDKNINLDADVMSIHELRPAIYNPRQISKSELEKLKNSIKQFGLTDPIIINLKNHNTIIGGHQRYKAMLEIMDEHGETDRDMIVIRKGDVGFVFDQDNLLVRDETHEKALNIALNKIQGQWNNYKLNYLLMDIESNGMNIKLTGFDEIDYNLDDVPLNNNLMGLNNQNKKSKLKNASEEVFPEEIEVIPPFYEPNPPKTKLTAKDLYTPPDNKYMEQINKIKDKDMAEFFKTRLCWLADINFDKVAQYYAYQATADEKKAIEMLGLVLLDKDKLIENGFIVLNEDLRKVHEKYSN